MSKITIIEGNSNDKDNERIFMLKGESGKDGVSPSASVSKTGNISTLTVTDAEGTTVTDIEDGNSPTVAVSKTGKTTTVTFTDVEGTHIATIHDGEDLTDGAVPTGSVIGFNGVAADVPGGYEVNDEPFPVITNQYSTSTSETYSADYMNDKIIVDSGSNANGTYAKFGDGTMICTMHITVTDQSINGTYGSLFQGTRTWTFPVPFVSTQGLSVHCGMFQWGSSASWGTVSTITTTDTTLRGIDCFSRASGTSTYISATAIGRWK